MSRTSRRVRRLSELNAGDHISFSRDVYYHHAIVIKVSYNKMTIVSFTNPCERMVGNGLTYQPAKNPPLSKKGALIAIEEYDAAGFQRESVYVYDYNNSFDLDKVIQRALSVQEGAIKWDPYDLFNNNCEHFATWCKTGRKESKQVNVAANVGIGLVVAGGLALLAGLAYNAFKEEPIREPRHKNSAKSYYY